VEKVLENPGILKSLKRVQTLAGNLCTVKPLLVDTSLIRTPLLWTIPYFPPKFSHTFLKKKPLYNNINNKRLYLKRVNT